MLCTECNKIDFNLDLSPSEEDRKEERTRTYSNTYGPQRLAAECDFCKIWSLEYGGTPARVHAEYVESEGEEAVTALLDETLLQERAYDRAAGKDAAHGLFQPRKALLSAELRCHSGDMLSGASCSIRQALMPCDQGPFADRGQDEQVFPRPVRSNEIDGRLAYETGSEMLDYRGPENVWVDLVEQYSAQKISVASDRLPAFSGIAHRFAEHYQQTLGKYLTGLWEAHMPQGLLWFIMLPDIDKVAEQDAEAYSMKYPGPSWSWVLAAGNTTRDERPTHEDQDSRRPTAVLEESRIVQKSMDPFGDIISVYLTLRGQLKRGFALLGVMGRQL